MKTNNSNFTYFHLRTFFLFLVFTLFFLFYPGNSYYIDFFSQHRDTFEAVERQKERSYDIGEFPVVNNASQPFLTGRGIYVIDLGSSAPVLEKNKDTQFFPASTTKIITALTAYDAFDTDEVLEVERIITEGQTVDFNLGEKLTFENLLYALLVQSGNDAAYIIADNYPGGYDAFIGAMNSKARQLGMQNSQFVDPAGFDNQNQRTTPFDLSLAGRALLENKDLSKIVSTKSITITDVDFKYTHEINSTNALLGKLAGVGGLKTGTTELAGQNFVTLYKKNGHEFLIVIMNSEERFVDTESIVQWLDANVSFEMES